MSPEFKNYRPAKCCGNCDECRLDCEDGNLICRDEFIVHKSQVCDEFKPKEFCQSPTTDESEELDEF